ncbi:unnamed protein product [Moneuplotes crassus]|uniref:Uncharacterized protein n=1 Tax=Euplotes crassus TaxID=5936 RepID=A0AAD2D927_EUPCR|nr:unnamed protein product [Moneuplotes crassus]
MHVLINFHGCSQQNCCSYHFDILSIKIIGYQFLHLARIFNTPYFCKFPLT